MSNFQSMGLGLTQNQTQKLALTQNQLQSIEILELSSQDLLKKIQKEVLENPLLLETSDKSHVSLKENYTKRYDLESKNNFLENTLQSPVTLYDHIKEQLVLYNLDKEELEITEAILSCLDVRGYLTQDLETLLPNSNKKKVERVLKLIQNVEPLGCAARNLSEALTIQAKSIRPYDENTILLLTKYFNELTHLEFQKILEMSNLNEVELKNSLDFIRTLEPHPASNYMQVRSQAIVPDIFVYVVENVNIEVVLNDINFPEVRLNPSYVSMQGKIKKFSKDYQYFKDKLQNAQSLISSLQKRKKTLYKVALALTKFQKEFFLKGLDFLKALNLQDLAEEINLHSSTISRCIANKYLNCQYGTFDLKYFFSAKKSRAHYGLNGSNENDSNNLITNKFIKERILYYIANEFNLVKKEKNITNENNKKTYVKKINLALSDKELSELLEKEGINVARRTITKYRKALSIPSASDRHKIKKYS